MKILSHYPLVLPSKTFTILELFAKPFPTESKPSKCPTKGKKPGKEKQKKRRGENAKGKRRGVSETFSKLLISAHARTSKAVICLQERKLVLCSTCKQGFAQFRFFLARQRPKNGLTGFKRHFLVKFPGVNGLNSAQKILKVLLHLWKTQEQENCVFKIPSTVE